MANKQLTAKVRINTNSAEKSLDRLVAKINKINAVVNKQAQASGLEKTIRRTVQEQDKANNKMSTILSKVRSWAINQRNVTTATRTTNNTLGSIWHKLKGIASAYLGIMGVRAVTTASDTITSAENRLNNIKGGNPKATAESMNKMYAAAQRSRSAYSDMMSNVSKTMALAGDAFQGNIDNAIRFQEIMAKSYSIGGASATEASTSMYQLVQALGSGVLQGDELRSLREGAPLAYKQIEKFAQGVLNTTESLKDLASKGVITSDMVVAAIMNAEEEINKSFENTKMTFAQAWDSIKNTALKAFEPVLQKLNSFLNSDAGKSVIKGIGNAIVMLANAVGWLIDVLSSFFTWCADNWEWLKYIVATAIVVIIGLFVKWAAVAVWTALTNLWSFITTHKVLLLVIAGILAILYVYELWRQGTISTTEAIIYCLTAIAVVALLLGIILGQMWLIWLAIAIAVIALIMIYFAEFCGYVNVGLQAIVNAGRWCGNLVTGIWNWIVAVWNNCVAGIVNVGTGLWNVICAIAQNIGIAFNNAWYGALRSFWDFIASCVEGLDWLAKPLEAIAELFGASFDYNGFASSLRSKADGYAAKQKEYVSVSEAWNSGMNTRTYQDPGEAWNNGWNTYSTFESGWASDAYNSGYKWGSNVEDAVNKWGSQFQDPSHSNGIFSDIANAFGLGDKFGSGLPNPNDPAYGLGNGYDPSAIDDDIKSALEKLGDIDDTTGDIKDSIDLSNDDLEYLRKIAEMEWRNEFTTAEIRVEMNNNNTVTSERSLDGIVEYLSDTLREEMTNVAYGVHY